MKKNKVLNAFINIIAGAAFMVFIISVLSVDSDSWVPFWCVIGSAAVFYVLAYLHDNLDLEGGEDDADLQDE